MWEMGGGLEAARQDREEGWVTLDGAGPGSCERRTGAPVRAPGGTAGPCKQVKRKGEEEVLCATRNALCLSTQDLAWMISFYVRLSLTYMPLLGLKGLLVLFFMVR